MSPKAFDPLSIKVDGHNKSVITYNLLEGEHRLKVISIGQRCHLDQSVYIQPGQWTEVRPDWFSLAPLDRSGNR